MSRARGCSVTKVSNGDNGSGTCTAVPQPPEGTFSRTDRPKHESKRSRSRNKIPKSVRYDLENSLVGLCDVWFEEIKPHLVRNNIKLHVDGADATTCAGEACASGDFEQRQVPAISPRCSHLDPGAAPDLPRRRGASYVGSSLTRLTASKAPCLKLQASTRHQDHPSPLSTVQQTPREHVQVRRPNSETKQVQRPQSSATYTRRMKRKHKPKSNWRVPRLCRTNSMYFTAVTQPLSRPFDEAYVRELFKSVYNKAPFALSHHHRRKDAKNKSTQTDPSMLVGVVEVIALPSQSPHRRNRSPAANITPIASPRTNRRSKQNQPSAIPVLFQDDLIDIIGEKHDERLKVIYNSPEQVKYPSLLNLVSPNNRRRKTASPKKIPPWR